MAFRLKRAPPLPWPLAPLPPAQPAAFSLHSSPPVLPQVWRRVSKRVLQPDQPFELHRLLFGAAYAGEALLGVEPIVFYNGVTSGLLGIGGGVALATLQLAKLAGARVIVTSGSDEKLAKAKALAASQRQRLGAINRAGLAAADRLNYDIVMYGLAVESVATAPLEVADR